MSKILENKHLVHIASEIVIIVGLTFYFNQQNKKLKSIIDDLSQRIEEQDELLKNHSQLIKKLVEHTNRIQMTHNNDNISGIISTDKKIKQNESRKSSFKRHHVKSPLSPPVNSMTKGDTPQVSFMKKHTEKLSVIEENSENSENSESDIESDLDAELAEEIEELRDSDSDSCIDTSDISLKKQ